MTRVVATAVGLLAGLAAWADGAEAVHLPDGSTLPHIDFDRHVASLFGRLGCNAGSCHGSFQGRGGLNLSLFGHDPARDYLALTRESGGRRVNVLDPDASLLLRKPAGLVPHEGGLRFRPGSWEYRVIRAWIAGGADRDPARPGVARIEVRPATLNLGRPGGSAKASVVAWFADGSEADVTPFCDLRVRDDAVAAVGVDGEVRGLRAGDSALVASYGGHLGSARVAVPTGRATSLPAVSPTSLVDREVNARLRDLGVTPSGPADDAEFLRRVTLDVIGTLPTPDEVRAFLADGSDGKRARTIDALLAHPMHAALWALRYLDITGCDVAAMEGPEDMRPVRARQWHDWLRARFAANTPYDELALGVLCATTRGGLDAGAWARQEAELVLAMKAGRPGEYAARPGLDLFWRRFVRDEFTPVEPLAERVAAAFLGVRIECAQCHKHPFDRWTQADYRGFANVVAGVRYGLSPEGLAATAGLLEERRRSDPSGSLPPIPRLREVYWSDGSSRRLADPATGRPLPPRAPGGPPLPAGGDPREALFAWLTEADNPYFARSFVNRVWAAYFGAGLVDPVDGFSVANPPTNPDLLDALADDFVANGYDIRRLERTILTSAAYQRSSAPVAGNLDDRGNFARSLPRPLMAEVLVDALDAALGVAGEYGVDAPKGSRAIEIATNRPASPELARRFRVLGRPERSAVCDCERPKAPALPQSLFLMADADLIARLKAGRVRALAESDRCDAEAVEELVLASLSRPPSEDEARSALDHLRATPDRASGLADVLWALINTREFVLNH